MAVELGRLPVALEQRPEMDFGMEWVWAAYMALSRTRSAGLGPGPIRLTEIEAYCRLKGINHADDIDSLIYFVGELDITYFELAEEKSKHGDSTGSVPRPTDAAPGGDRSHPGATAGN